MDDPAIEVNIHENSDSSSDSLHTISDLDDIDINGYEDPSTITPLMQAARSGNIEALKDILTRRSHAVNNANNQGLTPLHFAVIGKHLNCARMILQEDEINVDVQDWDGMTPLMHACQKRVPVDIIRCLLQHKCNVQLEDNWKMTALWYTLIGNEEQFARFDGIVIDLLTKHGADIHTPAIGPYDEPPISYVLTRRGLSPAVRAELAGALLYCGAEPTVSMNLIITLTDTSLYDMFVPYFSTCHVEDLMNYPIRTILAVWKVQSRYNKLRFAEIFEDSQCTLMKTLLISAQQYMHDRTKQMEDVVSFLYHLLEAEETCQVMYTESAGFAIQSEIIRKMFFRPAIEVADRVVADLLRISLCNCHELKYYTYGHIAVFVRNPIDTLRVLEDFNVTIYDIMHNPRTLSNRPTAVTDPLTCNRIWLLNSYPVTNILDESRSGEENKIKQSETPPPTLLKQCRKVIRERCMYDFHTSKKPYSYVARIKSLPYPKHLSDILLFRKRI